LTVRAENLRGHERGTQFDIVAEAGDAWRQRSTYLRRERSGAPRAVGPAPAEPGASPREPGASPREPAASPRAPDAVWAVPGNAGRRYAAISGDRNPIHLTPLIARAFGQPRPIAHGMWLKARCVSALDDVLPPACAIEVRFGSPLRLPTTAGFSTWEDK